MIRGVGLDLCDIGRMADCLKQQRFLDRVYTDAERARILGASERRRGEIAAGLFAAKEAVAKALGTGFDGFGPWDIEIAPDERGRPACALRGRAAELAGGAAIHVSITHESGMAAAVAVLEEAAQ